MHRSSPHLRRGFSLIELMVVIAIVGFLSSIAMPDLISQQHIAKRAEVVHNVVSIAHAQVAHQAENDDYVEVVNYHPRSTPTKQAVPWTAGSDFDDLGWNPDGSVRAVYKTELPSNGFTVTGETDVDGDGVHAIYHLTYDARKKSPITQAFQTPSTVK